MTTEIIAVHSSFILGAVYDERKQILRLEIHGVYYYYHGITKQKVSRFRHAASKGRYFVNYIKGKYEMFKRKIK